MQTKQDTHSLWAPTDTGIDATPFVFDCMKFIIRAQRAMYFFAVLSGSVGAFSSAWAVRLFFLVCCLRQRVLSSLFVLSGGHSG